MIALGRLVTVARAASLVLIAVGCASPATAPQPATAATASSPGGRAPAAILADAVAATGGVDGWKSHRSVHQKLLLTLKGMAMSGPVEHFQTSTDKSLTVTTLPAVGETRDGCNGSVLWAQDPVNGTRVLEGAEAEQARIEAAWNLEMEAPALFAKIETAPDAPAGPRVPGAHAQDRAAHARLLRPANPPRGQPRGDARDAAGTGAVQLDRLRLAARWAA